ncbi:MAG TPA: hypothetical protein PKY29_00765 [Ferruginibacter sp.]|mgnify:CR=1 FL=1|nr:hypothetical protein [Ferruginibacter sp.]HRO16749.1 hypothetical protein [Ferruginibacter sp.]HRQ19810.1 hypothetical protein [Ferruginibacter sp.]
MDFLDFIIFFLWVFIFHLFFSFRRKRYKRPVLKKYHRRGFWIKVMASLAYSMFVLYLSPGDTTLLYYPEGVNIYRLILDDPSNFSILIKPAAQFDQALLADISNSGYFDHESNFMVARFVAIFSFFTMGKFLAINLFFAMFAFTGAWRLYRFFFEQYEYLHKQFAIAIVFLPTFVFWSSGILKDSLCIAALGWVTYSMHSIFYTKNNIFRNLLMLLFFTWLLALVKVYILLSYMPFFILFLLLKNLKLIRSRFARAGLVLFFIAMSIVGFLSMSENIEDALGKFAGEGLTKSIQNYQEIYSHQIKSQDSNFSLGVEFDGTPQSLLKMAPAAIVATFYRPFLWESKKLSTLLSSIESLLLMIFTLYVMFKVGFIKFFVTIFRSPIVLYCFLFALIFGLFVGATTLNFGSLVRYKIPAMPFYVISLYLILDFHGKIKKNPG